MRIAQVAPLYESVPRQYYGGPERVVSYLTEELVRQGHDVGINVLRPSAAPPPGRPARGRARAAGRLRSRP
jgi:hypothetical protein